MSYNETLLKETKMKLLMHFVLTCLTGGLWLIVLAIKFLVK